jgi:hypothetical protein
MHKLFQVSHGRLHSPIRNRIRDSRILSPSLLFHTSTKTPGLKSKLDFIVNEVEELQYSQPTKKITQPAPETDDSSDVTCPTVAERTTVQISHPWPEWVDLMECLLKRGYIEGDGYPFRNSELGAKGSNHIRTACLNFARDRYDLIR